MKEKSKLTFKEKLVKLNRKKVANPKYTKKERITISLLTSFVFSFVFMFFGPIDIYANNMQELGVVFSAIIVPIISVFLATFIGIGLILYFTQSLLMNVFSSIILSFIVTCYINNICLGSVEFVSGDPSVVDTTQDNIFFVIFAVLFLVAFILSFVSTKVWKKSVVFLCILLIAMNGASLISDCINTDILKGDQKTCEYVLSEKDMFKVSKNDNVILILFDRFDTDFYDDVMEDDPTYFDDMDGFTYYDSATSVYSRTFPAVTALLTGVDYNADSEPSEYFNTAYSTSPFLNDLKNNGYDINLYCHRYYTYLDASVMKDTVNNVERVNSYSVNKYKTVKYLLTLSFARNYNIIMQYVMYASGNSGIQSGLTNIECDDTTFAPNDTEFYKKLSKNKVTYNDSNKKFSFLYLQGCHTPFILSKDCTLSDNADSVSQTEGAFLNVKDYLKCLKEIGAYDNSTIIITGDHAIPDSDYEGIDETADKGKTTSIWVKQKNSTSSGYKISHAPVSVDNIEATIVDDNNITTDNDYGKSIFDIKENDVVTRRLRQSIYNKNSRKLIYNEYTIKGDAKELSNWTLGNKFNSEIAWY